MRIEENRERPLLQLPGLESRVLPGGTEIYARQGELDFVARIVGIGIRLEQLPSGDVRSVVGEVKGEKI